MFVKYFTLKSKEIPELTYSEYVSSVKKKQKNAVSKSEHTENSSLLKISE